MIQALADKIIVEVMIAEKTKGGLFIPDGAAQAPQAYGMAFSVGEDIKNGTVTEGDYLIFHPRAGMDIVMNGKIFKVLKYDELYGRLQDAEIQKTLEPMVIGK